MNEETADELDAKAKAARARNKSSIADMAEIARNKRYIDYSALSAKDQPAEPAIEKEEEHHDEPYVISLVQYEEMGYDKVELILTCDGILCYQDGSIPEGMAEKVGEEYKRYADGAEDNQVHVRNDKLGTDYEIEVEEQTFFEQYGYNPQ
jgi:hypothetical protein